VWLDSRRMRLLTGGVCIKLLTTGGSIWVIRNVSGARILLRFPAVPNLSFPRFFCRPLEMLSNFIKLETAKAGL
jgi:hypothetical protein